MVTKENKLRKNFIWNTIGVTLNSLTSLFFMIIVTRVNGVSDAGIFTFAFSIALLVETIGTYSGRVFQVTENNKEISDSDYIYTHFLTALLMIIVGILFCFIKNYNIYKSMIMLTLILFRAVEAIEESLYAVIQKNDDLYKVGISFFLKSLFSIALFFIVDKITKNILFSSFCLLLVQIFIVIFYDLFNLKGYKFKLNKFKIKNVIFILKSGLFTFAFLILSQILINIPKNAIDNFLSNSSQTIYGIIAMPTTVMILLGQYLIHPILNKLNEYVKENKYNDFNKLVLKITSLLFVLGMCIIVVAYFIGIPVLELLYGTKLKKYKLGLTLILFGSILYGIVNIFSNSLIALRKTFGQTLIFLIVDILGVVLSNILVVKYKVYGAIYTYLILMLFLLILYIIYYIISLRRKKECVKYET